MGLNPLELFPEYSNRDSALPVHHRKRTTGSHQVENSKGMPVEGRENPGVVPGTLRPAREIAAQTIPEMRSSCSGRTLQNPLRSPQELPEENLATSAATVGA